MLQLRQPVRSNRQRQAVLQSKSVVAPIEGWDASSALAQMRPLRAVQLKNWFPQPGYVEVRKGHKYQSWDLGSSPITVTADATTDKLTATSHGLANGTLVKFHATTTLPGGLSATGQYYVVSTASNDFKVSLTSGGTAVDLTSAGSGTITVYTLNEPLVQTLAVWQGPSSSKLFAAAGNAIWDVTSTAAATFAYGTSLTVNRWQQTMQRTSAGAFLWLCNGTDAPIHYNGSAWAAPSITGITASDIVHVNVHKKRLWFVLNNSTNAAYLGTEAIAGAATSFAVGANFTRGGYLLAMATWTRDGGSGPDDYAVFISSRGQVALYQGTDPASASTFAHVGTFDVPTPIGRRCFQKYGADLLLVTVEGVFPLSQLLAVDESQADRVAITDRISQAFNTAAISYGSNFGWEVCVYAKGTRLIVNIPTAENSTAVQYVMNTLTGAWCEFDSHNANTWAVYNDNIYFAGNDGDVFQADTGRTDVDAPIVAIGQCAYQAFGTAKTKRFSMMRPLITVSGSNRPSLGMSVDFVETSELSTLPAGAASSGALWDSATWDSSVWPEGDQQINDWAPLGALGLFGSVKFRATTGTTSGRSGWGVSQWGVSLWGGQGSSDETMRIQGFLVLYEAGGLL